MAAYRALILQRHRHLKWRAFDKLEAILMVLCGVCIFLFTLSVFCDVITRTIGAPWLWLQQVTTGCFAWGVFIGMAAATRRNDHFYLTEITKRMTGSKRSAVDMGSYRMPSLVPLAVYTGIVPVAAALVALFTLEQLVNGWKNGFEGPEDRDDLPVVELAE
jgi:TRAP-type transport system small permease protein